MINLLRYKEWKGLFESKIDRKISDKIFLKELNNPNKKETIKLTGPEAKSGISELFDKFKDSIGAGTNNIKDFLIKFKGIKPQDNAPSSPVKSEVSPQVRVTEAVEGKENIPEAIAKLALVYLNKNKQKVRDGINWGMEKSIPSINSELDKNVNKHYGETYDVPGPYDIWWGVNVKVELTSWLITQLGEFQLIEYDGEQFIRFMVSGQFKISGKFDVGYDTIYNSVTCDIQTLCYIGINSRNLQICAPNINITTGWLDCAVVWARIYNNNLEIKNVAFGKHSWPLPIQSQVASAFATDPMVIKLKDSAPELDTYIASLSK